MSNELTDVRCPCGAEFQADSYDAGFIAGSGMCQNCDAALPPKDICTCPSGNGSLRHPCPAHPAVEQAGGDERDFQAEGAQEVPSPVSQEYDRHLISLLRKGEALPGHQEEAADEIERLRDWNDHLNNTVLPNILNPTFLMLMKGGERLLDLCTKDGEFIGVSLNDMKDVFDWMVTHARIAPDHAALAQPSGEVVVTKNESGAIVSVTRQDKEGRVLSVIAESATLTAQAEKAEVERPEVVAWQYRVTAGPQTGWSLWHPGKGEEFERSYTVERRPLMTVTQHDRMALERWQYFRRKMRQMRDLMRGMRDRLNAAQAKVAELEKQEPVATVARVPGEDWNGLHFYRDLQGMQPGTKLYAAPVSQAQRSVPEEFSFEYRHPNGECHTVTVSREQVINEMPDFLFEALCSKLCNCEPVGETNVVECRCDEYAEEFKLIAAAPGNEGV